MAVPFRLALLSPGLRPCYWPQYNFDSKVVDEHRKLFRRLFEEKGAARTKEPAIGKAQPFLTSGGEAEANNKMI